jgi:hypothetical protein
VAQLAAYRNDPKGHAACVERFLAIEPTDDARITYADSAVHIASGAVQTGMPAVGRALLDRAESVLGARVERYPLVHAWLLTVRCTWLRHTDDDLARQAPLLELACWLYTEGGAPGMLVIFVEDNLGEVECRAGRVSEGLARLRRSHAVAVDHGVGMAVSHARLALANGLLAAGDARSCAEAAELAGRILATPGISDGYRAMAQDVLSAVALARGDFATAEREAREAAALSPHTPVRRWLMVARRARALCGLGRHDEAYACAAEAVREMDAAGTGGGYAEPTLLGAAEESARCSGRAEESLALAARSRVRTARLAEGFTDPSQRARYLAHAAPSSR